MAVQITKRPLLPVIEIKKNDSTLYTYNPFTLQFDFYLGFLQFNPVIDHSGGRFNMQLNFANNTNANTFLNNIGEGNEVTIYLGKNNTDRVKQFLGIIETIAIAEYTKTNMQITLSGPDWGSDLLQGRVVIGYWEQKKIAGTTNADDSDDTTLIENIIYDLLTKKECYVAADYSAQDQGVIVSLANMVQTGFKLPQFAVNMEKLGDVLKELNHTAGTECFIDQNKTFKLVAPETRDSGFLLTDDYNDPVAATWDLTKLGFIMPGATYTKTIETNLRRLIGVGGAFREVGLSQMDTTATTSMHANYVAMRFTPEKKDTDSIALYLSKVGSPLLDFVMELVEADSAGLPKGSTIRVVSLNRAAISTTGAWHYFDISDELNTKKDHYIIARKTGDAANTYLWHRSTAGTHTTTTSADGVTWAAPASGYGYAYQHITNAPLIHIYNHAGLNANTKHFAEEVYRQPGLKDYESLYKFLIGEGGIAMHKKEVFDANIIAPDASLQTNQKIRIRKIASGLQLDGYYVIGHLEYTFDAGGPSATGIFYYTITASRFSHYST